MRALLCFISSAVVFTSASAHAEVCVSLDGSSDTLEPSDQKAVIKVVESAFRQEGETVVNTPCSEQYTIYNLKLGKSVQAVMSGPRGERSGRVSTIEDLPRIYSQMVRSVLNGTPMSNDGSVSRDNVTADQAAPRRVEADSMWYLRLGAGSVTGGDFNWGPSFGFGYRYELDHWGIDASANLYIGTERDVENDELDLGLSGSLIKLMGLYFFDATGNASPYVGAGISYGGAAVIDEISDGSGGSTTDTFAGGGLQGELSVGYELLRASTIRMFVAFDATLPFYQSSADIGFGDDDETRYTPTFGLSLGFGFGRSNTKNINVTQTSL
ncbi:MAG: hypothetical protein AAFQ82_11050 [Myxococcota bacterium]